MSDTNFKYQSNDNYPWEYDDQVEVWVADFSVRKYQAKQAAIDEGLVMEEEFIDTTPEEIITESGIEDLIEHSIQQRGETLAALKARSEFSWIIATVVILIIVVAGEVALYDIGNKFFWSLQWLIGAIWLWRLLVLIVWLYLSLKNWQFNNTKVYAATVSAFVLGVIVSAIWKIVIIGAVWTWLNLLIEPIWMVLLIALVGSIFTKFILPDKYGRYKG